MRDIWDQKLCPNRGIAWLKSYAPNCLAKKLCPNRGIAWLKSYAPIGDCFWGLLGYAPPQQIRNKKYLHNVCVNT